MKLVNSKENIGVYIRSKLNESEWIYFKYLEKDK